MSTDSDHEEGGGYEFDDVHIDFHSFRVTKANVPRPLTPRAFDVLRYLVEHRDRLVERRELFDRFWRDVVVTDNALTRVIREIRQALDDDAGSPRYVATVPKRGFRFVASATPRSSARTVGASVAVLPFTNLSEGPDAEYLCDGIATAVINLLSELSGVRVMARTTVFSYKGRLPPEPRRVGADLNVGFVLLGTLDLRDGRLKIAVELVAAGDGSLLWAQEYDREMRDVLAVQREIAQRIAEQLHLKLSALERRRLSARPSTDVDSYRLYLQGYYALYTFTPEGLDRSLDYFNQATAKNPGNALAYAGLVEAYFNYSFLKSPLEVWPKAKLSALRALELDPHLAEAHYAMALVSFCFDRDWQTAEAEFRRAIDLKPGYAQAREWYAWSVLAQSGRFDEAMAEFRIALDLDPLSLAASTDYGTCLYWAGRLEEAAAVLGRVLELEDRFYVAHLFLGLTLLKAGDSGRAISELRKAVAQSNNPVCIGFLGHALATVGETAEARAHLEQLCASAREGYVPSDAMGVVHIGLGELDEAFEHMQRACDERTVVSLTLKVEPAFERLRSDRRFGELLRRGGLGR